MTILSWAKAGCAKIAAQKIAVQKSAVQKSAVQNGIGKTCFMVISKSGPTLRILSAFSWISKNFLPQTILSPAGFNALDAPRQAGA
ncbi:MAG: hypothetical protein WBC90_02340 [Albidovulum sp.]